MKTKSKRFLKLATLCLALLSTTLLMTQPVSAGGNNEYPQTSDVSSSGRSGHSSTINEEGDLYGQSYDEGFEKGYEEGQRSDTSNVNRDSIKVPGHLDDTGYRDGFEGGYGAGWRNTHPVEAFLGEVWGFLTSIFKGWFSQGAGSQ
ncbi:TPA: hypothetical protein ACQNPB_001753 [Streptococcus pyogenes]|uniref:hypothetical protein n=2 Tax=Streptococcus pyogenes TaxID=1314 RepID=UPI0015737D33|nr:hypothetical protein [Streptococcus pyogenes]HEP1684559.1 hypothetical protein [Streptococcus pyogenes]HEP1694534.1 hypothetical protein [Streptococcus pyogenes]HEP1707722.1 hypothetical protein [Streptococcus pyogenes]HEP1709846.1 hypothetical protein [Streptococcus pyogenes]